LAAHFRLPVAYFMDISDQINRYPPAARFKTEITGLFLATGVLFSVGTNSLIRVAASLPDVFRNATMAWDRFWASLDREDSGRGSRSNNSA